MKKKHNICIIFTYKHFSNYLANENGNTIFLTSYLLSTLIRLLAQIVYLTEYYSFQKNEISNQLSDLFSLSFMTVVFPLVIKTAKVPIFKIDSKLQRLK